MAISTTEIQGLLEKTRTKDQEAQFSLGCAYDDGKGVPKDKKKACEWWRKAAQQGHVEAQYRLGKTYIDGSFGILKNWQRARHWLFKAAQHGHVDAQYTLGKAYATGWRSGQNHKIACEWYRKAAEQGHLAAKEDLKAMEARGIFEARLVLRSLLSTQINSSFEQLWTVPDEIQILLRKAEQGDSDAQFNLGLAYAFGRAVKLDKKKACEWYQKAAEQGNPWAQSNFGGAYSCGEGVPQDHKKACEWWQKAAKQGRREAQYNLGMAYAHGRGIPKNDKKACYWFQKAAEQGDVDAELQLKSIAKTTVTEIA